MKSYYQIYVGLQSASERQRDDSTSLRRSGTTRLPT
jgi:hypothetical protein